MIHSIDDQVTLNCYIDANPEPKIDWFHRFMNNDQENIVLSNEFSLNSTRIINKTIEQINATRWKTILFIQVKYFINYSFLKFIKILLKKNHFSFCDFKKIKSDQINY